MNITSSRPPSVSCTASPALGPRLRTPRKIPAAILRVISAIILAWAGVSDAAIADFEDLALPPESYWNGADSAGGFSSIGAFFKNNYNPKWGSWDGFAYSNRTDKQVQGVDGQYNAIAGSGHRQSPTYGVAYVGWTELPTMTLSMPRQLDGLYVTNNNYAYYALRDGSQFSKKFGGASGADADWFRLTITGQDAAGEPTGKVEFYLADFRPLDNAEDYIVKSWEFVDLTSLGVVKSLQFALDSSDVGAFGMSTPGYFALDTVVPEPATLLLLGCGALFAGCRRR